MGEIKLDELTEERGKAFTGNPSRYNPFGLSREGRLIEGMQWNRLNRQMHIIL